MVLKHTENRRMLTNIIPEGRETRGNLKAENTRHVRSL